MNNVAAALVILSCFTTVALAQKANGGSNIKSTVSTSFASSEALDLAKAAFTAHGGDKFRSVKTMVLRGSVDLTSSAFNQALPGAFSMAYAGDKYRVELATAVQSFKQTYDGQETRTSVQMGFSLPPINRLGLPLLQRLGDEGFTVSPLPEGSKKGRGFRITAPDNYFTDFFIDEKTRQVKGYEAMYEYSGRMFSTSVEIGKYRDVDGVIIPEKYSQRFDLGQLIVYGDFKTKDVLLNTPIGDDVFNAAKP
jgi:hypothetical protein